MRGVVLAVIGIALGVAALLLLSASPSRLAAACRVPLVLIIDGQVTLHQFRGLREVRVQRYSLIDLITAWPDAFRDRPGIRLQERVGNHRVDVHRERVKVWAGYFLFPGLPCASGWTEIAGDLWRFSQVIAVSSALTLVIGQVDKLVSRALLPLDQFGIYVIAASLAAAPNAFAANYAAAIVYPAAAAAAEKFVRRSLTPIIAAGAASFTSMRSVAGR